MGPNDKQPDGFAELDELTPEEIAENFGEAGEEHADGADHDDGKVQPAPAKHVPRPLRPGESIGGYTHD